MAANTKIEWCDHTFNPWSGCAKVSPGCAHCYAEALSKRSPKTFGQWGKGAPRRRTGAINWNLPVKWNSDAFAAIENIRHTNAFGPAGMALVPEPPRPRVFCASLADWLDDEVPVEWLADLLSLIVKTPRLDWLLLTKRPQNFSHRILGAASWLRGGAPGTPREWIVDWEDGSPPPNVWIGTTVEDQQRADERIPLLLKIPARVRFLSCEPLLGPVDIATPLLTAKYAAAEGKTITELLDPGQPDPEWIDWVICGGESGPGARPMKAEWARSLREQCKHAGVAFLFKQWGEHDEHGNKVGKAAAGKLLDGVEHLEFPAVGGNAP